MSAQGSAKQVKLTARQWRHSGLWVILLLLAPWVGGAASLSSLNVWRPVNFDPIASSDPIIRFSVSMSIIDSTNREYDCFRWSVYNSDGGRLFSLDFDNDTTVISYALEDSTNFISTGLKFTNSILYDLVISMNFANNSWSATLDDRTLASAQAITTRGSPLTLGDVDAVWAFKNPDAPGNNYLVFDNYQLVAQNTGRRLYSTGFEGSEGYDPNLTLVGQNGWVGSATGGNGFVTEFFTGEGVQAFIGFNPPTNAPASAPIHLEALGLLQNRQFALRVSGEAGQTYVVEASADLRNWTAIRTNAAPSGTFDFIDAAAPGFSRRFYRARTGP